MIRAAMSKFVIPFIKNVFVGLCIAAVFFILVELAIRVLFPFPLTSITTYEAYDDVLYFHKPESVGYELSYVKEFDPVKLEYNELGFRGDWDELPQDKERIVLLGDSYIEARQVEENESAVGRLNQIFQDKFFINAGCSAYTTTTEYLLLKNRIIKLKPSKVFLFIAFNDYSDNYWYSGGYYKQKNIFSEKPNEEYVPKVYHQFFEQWDNVLITNLAIYAYMKQFMKKEFVPTLWKEVAEGKKIYNSPRMINKADKDLDELEHEVVDFTHQGIEEIARLCRDNGIDLTVAVIPIPPQVNADEWPTGKVTWGYSEKAFIQSKVYQQRLISFLEGHHIKHIDLLPAFNNAAPKGRIFYDFDGHWTSYGNQVVAKTIASKLQ